MKITIEIEEKELSALIDNQKRTKKEKFNEFTKYFSDELKKTIRNHSHIKGGVKWATQQQN